MSTKRVNEILESARVIAPQALQHEFQPTDDGSRDGIGETPAAGEPITDLDAARAFAAAPQIGPAPVDQYTGPRSQPNHIPAVWNAAKYTPTPSLNEAQITSLENFDEHDAALAQARNAFSTATETLKQISAAREPLSRDTSKTPEQKLLLMAGIAEKQQERVTRAMDGALKTLTKAADEIERQLTAPLEQTTHTAICQEIRAYVRSLPKDERDAFVNDAVKRGDMQVMNSVLGGPSYLSGIAEERKAIWLRDYRSKADPIAVMRLAVYRAAIDRVTAYGPLVFPEFEKAQGGSHKNVRRLRGQVSASDAALAALSGE